jgi:hypothetical protein
MSGYFAAFRSGICLAAGTRLDVARAAQAAGDRDGPVLIFDPEGRQIDLDLRGTPDDLAARLTTEDPDAAGPRGRGRPKLGVTAREVTLLPRHWDWLAAQPGGASVALRKLVEAARREAEAPDRLRHAREATYRFASAVAGDLSGFEEAMRALFAGDGAAFETRITAWPKDLAEHVRRLSADAFAPASG